MKPLSNSAPAGPTSSERYEVSLANLIDERPPDEWRPFAEHASDPMLLPEMVRVLERGFHGEARFWNAVVRDERGRLVAAALLSLYTLDGALFMMGGLARLVGLVRRVWPGFLRLKVVFCGSPMSAGQSHLRVLPGADRARTIAALDTTMEQIASKHAAPLLVCKEFGPAERWVLEALARFGYRVVDSPPMNVFPSGRFGSLPEVVAAMRSKYRRRVAQARKRLAEADLRVVHLRGDQGAEAFFTPEVYRLYLAVLEEAEVKLERLTLDFFRALARELGAKSRFTFLFQGERVVAFVCGISASGYCQNLFCGYDKERNAQGELYFNVLLEDLDAVLRLSPHTIRIGQTCDEFKSGFGCVLEPRSFAVRARSLVFAFLLFTCRRIFFPPLAQQPVHDPFKGAAPQPT